MIQVEYQDDVVIAKLAHNITNAIDLEVVNKLADILERVKNDPDVHSFILSSSNEKFFSIGFNIPQLFTLPKADFEIFYKAFNQICIDLYTLPKPTIASITGHAVAGGCIIALCCDYRYIAEGRKKMGLNEIKLGVPIPYPVDCILRQIVGFRHAREIMDTGEFYDPETLLQMGIVDAVLPLAQLQVKAIEKVRSLGAFPQEAFAMIKRNRVELVETQILSRLEEKEKAFLECWYSDDTRERLKEAMEKF